MIKKDKHPKWYVAKIFFEGKVILEIGSTKPELSVDIWSGNHPYYLGSQKIIIDTEKRIENFEKKYNISQKNEKENDIL